MRIAHARSSKPTGPAQWRGPGESRSPNFSLVTEPVAAAGEGEILVENRFLSVDPAQRGWANDEGNYSARYR
jgi:NADPH-dependent curcumin reductase CurA